jgi:hypothetical protein
MYVYIHIYIYVGICIYIHPYTFTSRTSLCGFCATDGALLLQQGGIAAAAILADSMAMH